MGIDALSSSLITDAKGEASEIVNSAEWHVKKMLSDEKAKISESAKEAEKEARLEVEEYRRERIAWARLEKKRMLAEAREDSIKVALDDVYSELKNIRKTKEYKKILEHLVAKAIKELNEKDIVVHVPVGDNSSPSNSTYNVVADLDSIGGAIVETSDGRFRMNFSFEALFESKRDELRKKISERLFGS